MMTSAHLYTVPIYRAPYKLGELVALVDHIAVIENPPSLPRSYH